MEIVSVIVCINFLSSHFTNMLRVTVGFRLHFPACSTQFNRPYILFYVSYEQNWIVDTLICVDKLWCDHLFWKDVID
jgi:hypothetical protein